MTPIEIAYFKHYLFDKGIQAIYISMYRSSRITGNPDGSPGNPESLEEFFQQTPPWRVVMHAFYFKPNSDYGYDYWSDINNKWKSYWDIHKDNNSNDKYVTLKGTFAILRQNWDSPKYWKTETMEATYKRMNMEPPLKGVDLETAFIVPRNDNNGPKFSVGDVIKGTISGEVLKVMALNMKERIYEMSDGGVIDFEKEQYWEPSNEEPIMMPKEGWFNEIDDEEEESEQKLIEFSDVPEAEEQKKNPGAVLEGFSLVDTINPHGGRRISTNVVVVNLRSGGYRLSFSTKQSDKLRKHKYEYVKLLTNKDTKEVALVFNHLNGCRVNIKGTSESKSIVINSKDIVSHIHKFYGLSKDEDYYNLDITATIQQDNNTIYKLKYTE